MPLRLLEISAPEASFAAVKNVAEKNSAIDYWHSAKNKDGRRTVSILIHLENQQSLTDDLQRAMNKDDHWRLVVVPVDATIPKLESSAPADDENGNGKAKISIINKNDKKYLSYSYGAKVDGKIMIVGNRLINASVKLLINQTFQSFVHKKRSNETILKKFLKILGINI